MLCTVACIDGVQDPKVQEAVAELQARKQELAELQAKYKAALEEAEALAAAPPTMESYDDPPSVEEEAQ